MKKHFYWIMGIILIACACKSTPQQEAEGKVYQVGFPGVTKMKEELLKALNQ